MKQNKTGTCVFKGIKEQLTVGDIFELHCEWSPAFILSPPLFIQTKDHPYALVILDTISIDPGKGSFKVTSYKPGVYNTSFKILSAKDTILFQNPGWSVDSVIPQQQINTIQPHPPYGPWKQPLPGWYWLSGLLCLAILVSWILHKWYTYFHRKAFVRKIEDRLRGQNSFHGFIRELTKLNRQISNLPVHQIVQNLKIHWHHFLENQLLISVEGKSLKQVMRQIKHYHPLLYKKHLSTIVKFWTELEKSLLSSKKLNEMDCEHLLTMGRETSITIYQTGK